MNSKYAIITAGGIGARMGAGIPKQFILLGGKPIIMRTVEAFYNFDAKINIILALPKTEIAEWQNLCKKYFFNIKCEIVEGGKERFHSVKNALERVPDDSFVAIHDGVRPFASAETIERCFAAAEIFGNAVPVLPAEESVRIVENEQNFIINRAKLRIVQTPQVFNSNLIKCAYQTDFSPEFTDDASVLEKSGFAINLVQGNRENIKITTPFDLKVAETLWIK